MIIPLPAAYRLTTAVKPSLNKLRLIIRTLRYRLLRQTDTTRWKDLRNFDPSWDLRTQAVAHLIPKGSRIIEFGAGTQCLASCLDATCTYIPADLVRRGSNMMVFDLNNRPLPDLRALDLDVAVFGGVLEYIADIRDIPQWLSGQASLCIASYECSTPGLRTKEKLLERLSRISNGWVNHYTEPELKDLFRAGGFDFHSKAQWGLPGSEGSIFVFRKLQ